MPFCTSCGTQNPDDANFCFKCGARLVKQDDSGTGQFAAVDPTATIPLAGAMSAGATSDKTETSDRDLSPVEAAAVDALPIGHALLVVQRGPGAGNRFLLDSDVAKAGRHPSCDIFLDDVTVSRQHATFSRNGAEFTVSDSGSLNGTYVNRKSVDEARLSDGDEVQVGKFRFVFFAGREQG